MISETKAERRGSGVGEKRGDHSPENLARNVLEEQLAEVTSRTQRNLVGDSKEIGHFDTALRLISALYSEVKEVRAYNVEIEDPNNIALAQAARKAYTASQRLEAALEARNLPMARQLIRLALEELRHGPEPELKPAA